MKNTKNLFLPTFRLVQVIIWFTLYGLWTLYTISKWNNVAYGIFGGLVSFIFYLFACYVNQSWLIPMFLKKRGWVSYLTRSMSVLISIVFLRIIAEYYLIHPIHPSFYNMGISHIALALFTTVLAFLFGGLLRLTIDYIQLEQHQKDLVAKQADTELKLLKAQVQPHFIFNTLNNIYYLALAKDEKAPVAIAKLSDTMRYFTDEAHKDLVPLETEITFIRNYIMLEQMRMPNPVTIVFDTDTVDGSIRIPPMILIPLVENIYKHGINKTLQHNEAVISIYTEGSQLVFTTKNRMLRASLHKESKKGLQNLHERLNILFEDNFSLQIRKERDAFITILKVPFS